MAVYYRCFKDLMVHDATYSLSKQARLNTYANELFTDPATLPNTRLQDPTFRSSLMLMRTCLKSRS